MGWRDDILEHRRKIVSGEATCRNCIYADNFDPRSDEPSAHGCHKRGIEGYVLDPDKPRCVLELDWLERKSND
jgi:hypothetical protein